MRRKLKSRTPTSIESVNQEHRMSRHRIGAVLAGLVIGTAALSAQATTAPAKKSSPVRDSLKALNGDIKQDKAERKAAKAKGDTAAVKAATKDIKQDQKAKAALKKNLPPRKTPTSKP